jgi:hypothetical protein
MSPRKTILRELDRARREQPSSPALRPSTLPGYADRPDRFQSAVNELLQARLLEGRKDNEGRMTIALNEHRLADVKKELRPLWAHPAVWALLALAIVAVGARLAI